jgi:hypothetical protein
MEFVAICFLCLFIVSCVFVFGWAAGYRYGFYRGWTEKLLSDKEAKIAKAVERKDR